MDTSDEKSRGAPFTSNGVRYFNDCIYNYSLHPRMGRNTAVEFAFSLRDGFFIARPAGDSNAGGATATPALVAVREILDSELMPISPFLIRCSYRESH
ncbi:hypothetical protein MRB53_015804 [Persea americana]|uniref:Uncharacterized protein n=1 Tax=Persea americana TaxID=3435 RepID=A0ACC2M0C6_PERAE|nr:hypothetical protein MRB53_015804 [Persea americana]